MATIILVVACNPAEPADVLYEHAYRAYVHGDLLKGRDLAASGRQRFSKTNPQWAAKFQVLEAEIYVFGGESGNALTVLRDLPANIPVDVAIDGLALRTAAQARLHLFSDAALSLAAAQTLCDEHLLPPCGGVMRAQGFLVMQRGDNEKAATHFQESLTFAHAHDDQYLETSALLNLGLCATQLRHFDEAIDWLERARASAVRLGAGLAETKAVGDLGWVYYNLGDFDRSLDLTLQAKKRAVELNDGFDELAWEMDAGQVYAARGEPSEAEASFQQALKKARELDSKQDIIDGLTVLAALTLQTGKYQEAVRYSDEALAIARAAQNHSAELDLLLVQGAVAARTHEYSKAELILRSILQDPAASDSLKWQSEYSLAGMYEAQGQVETAKHSYETALANFERARSQLSRDELRLPFLTNATNIYDDYIQLLASQGSPEQALNVADFGRAQTLAEGLGLLPPGGKFAPGNLDPRAIARHLHGSILFYSLASRGSYLWVINAQNIHLFRLPAASEIDRQVQLHRKLLMGPRDALAAEDNELFDTLVAPALGVLQRDSRLIVIPDGSLNGLNFETLVVRAPTPHYLIEDATMLYASSLRILAGAERKTIGLQRNLLLMGDSLPAGADYSPLAHAEIEMQVVGKHFDRASESIFAGGLATPAAYVTSRPERFSFLHFVAHGTANRFSPLDSAVILSKANGSELSYKLYAREILQHPLHADLVTISSCYGSGSRTYSGEGLVGLSWAFLRAGAHHVIAALWEVSDDSTPQLMDALYTELAHGEPPETALRRAKLSLLHSSGVFRRPFYWGPFQLYLGS